MSVSFGVGEQPLILSLDTSQNTASLALSQGTQLIAGSQWEGPQSHTQYLPIHLQNILEQSKITLSSIDAIAVGHGPGSFTGVRIGLSFIKGLAFGLEKPVFGISSLESLAFAAPFSDWVCPLLDARRSQVYAACYCKSKNAFFDIVPEQAIAIEEFLELLLATNSAEEPVCFLGSGARCYQSIIEQALGQRAIFLDPENDKIQAAVLSQLALRRWHRRRTGVEAEQLAPHYLRASEAERQRKNQ